MLKKILLVFLLFLVCSCDKNSNDVVTLIDDNDSYIVSINYPVTKSSKLNRIIKKDVNKSFTSFKRNIIDDDVKKSFNVDFKYDFINNRYINVTLEKNINDSVFVSTYVFDIKKNKLLDIYDVFNKNDLNILSDKIKYFLTDNNIQNGIIDDTLKDMDDLNFVFDDTYFYFYFNFNKIIILKLSVDIFDLDIDIKKDVKQNNLYTYKEVNKVIDPKGKVVAFTFDDGPSKYTKQVIDLLNEYGANGTFFVLGNKVGIFSDTLKYLLDSGNEIGNHSYNHKWLTHVSDDELINQITSTQDIIYSTLNYKPILFRPTYGSVNEAIRNNVNLDIVLWNVDTLDWKYKNGNKIASRALDKIKDGSIVLMHDTHSYTYDALKIMLPKLKNLGYQFVTVSELNEVNKLRNAK